MEQSISFRFRNTDTGQWDGIPLSTFDGSTIGEVVKLCEGKEVVAEVIQVLDDGREWKGYLCGTTKWVKHYQEKGFSAKGFKEGVELLEGKGSPLVGGLSPGARELLSAVEETFPGTQVDSFAVEPALFWLTTFSKVDRS
jgi:hypothetical protein